MGSDETVKEESAKEFPATVVELLPSAMYRVQLDTQEQVLAHLVATTGRNFVRVRPGDRVRVALSPHDRTRGRITQLLA